MSRKISRRQFLKIFAATSGAAITTTCGLFKKPIPNGKAWEIEDAGNIYMPYITKSVPTLPPPVYLNALKPVG